MPAKKEEMKKKVATQSSLPMETTETMRNTMHKKAGLLFPVGRILRLMKEGRYADRISPKCAVGVAAVLEYLTAEILEMSGDGCFDSERQMASKNIKPRHICLAVKGDEEMSKAIGPHVIIPMGGVIPFIHEELEKKPKRKMRNKNMDKFKDDQAEQSGDEDDDEEDSTEEQDDEDQE